MVIYDRRISGAQNKRVTVQIIVTAITQLLAGMNTEMGERYAVIVTNLHPFERPLMDWLKEFF